MAVRRDIKAERDAPEVGCDIAEPEPPAGVQPTPGQITQQVERVTDVGSQKNADQMDEHGAPLSVGKVAGRPWRQASGNLFFDPRPRGGGMIG